MKQIFLILMFPAFGLLAENVAETAFKAGDYKKSIAAFQEIIKSIPDDQKGPLLVQLASAYWKDQYQEPAFKNFLNALHYTSAAPSPALSEDEQKLYEQGLKIYLDHLLSGSPKEMARQLLGVGKATMEAHPDYYLLNLLLSTAYANLGQFEEFFNAFYRSYPYYSNHYLTYKTQAILHIKLFEREASLKSKDEQRQLVYEYITKAMEQNPQDISLYKIGLSFTLAGEQKSVLKTYLNQIIEKNIVIPRHDVAAFVQQAIEFNELDLAQKIVDKSREWYQYSRVIDEVQHSLNQHKANKIHE
jgi:hypothetical protein